MNFSQWLSEWLTRHPLKGPAISDPDRYTSEVMQRVKQETAGHAGATVPGSRAWWAWPQAGLSFAAAAACLVVAVWSVRQVTGPQPGPQVAEQGIASEAELLAQLDEPGNGLIEPDLDEEAEELDAEELLVLAEAPEDDAAWVTETLQLLERLEEAPDAGTGSAEPASNEEWLEELELLDENEMAASS